MDTWLVVDPHSEDDTSAVKEWLQGERKDMMNVGWPLNGEKIYVCIPDRSCIPDYDKVRVAAVACRLSEVLIGCQLV